MACALCRKNRELCRSHIVPEFFHRPIYNEDHRTLAFRHGESRATIMQKGARENLLCRGCEDQFQRYEDYYSKYWYRHPAPAKGELGGSLVLRDLDYRKLKLLLLSIAWRASVAKQELFSSADLGSTHEEAIRKMLVGEEPGTRRDYPIVACLIIDPGTNTLWDKSMLLPLRMKVRDLWACRMVFGGVSWTVFVSSHQRPPLESHWLTEQGAIQMPCVNYEDYARESGMIDAAGAVQL
jgi:hypothetical protein